MESFEIFNETESAPAVDGLSCEPQLMEVDGNEVVVSGNPFEIGRELDSEQGDNYFNFQGDCGLVSVVNLLTLAGVENVTEDSIVATAIRFNLCNFSSRNEPYDNGGTTVLDRQYLLSLYGVTSEIHMGCFPDGSLESVAQYVESGYGVNMSYNAGYVWDNPNYIQDGSSNHSVIVTGTCRDAQTGELKGFYVCDSGIKNEAMFVSVETLQDAYINAPGAAVLVTDKPIR